MIPVGTVQSWHCPPPAIDTARLLRVHRYTDPEKVRPVIRAAAAVSVKSASELSQPTARYVIADILSLDSETLSLSGGQQFHCPAFADHLAGCEKLLAFVMTLGPNLDNQTVSLMEEQFEPLDALFLETSGWLTIEASTRLFIAQFKRRAAEAGWRLSLRMGPGYEYRLRDSERRVRWDLTDQVALFKLFGDAPLPVELMQSCAMTPKMSRSGIYGLSRIA